MKKQKTIAQINDKFESNLFLTTENKLPKKIAVAVSGGADSMALAILMLEFTKHLDIDLYAFTVDHGLRKSSKKEAIYVNKILTKLGYVHRTLIWAGKKPTTKIEEVARKKRYELIFKECKELGIEYLATAHHKDDQIETLLMRFFKGSGADGLCGIPSMREEDGIKIIRPLLYLSKKEIKDICKLHKIKWKEDESNKDDKFMRNKIRKMCTSLRKQNILTDEILLARERAESESSALNNIANKAFENLITIKQNELIMDKKEFFALEKEIQFRLLQKMLDYFNVGSYSCKRKSIETVLNNLNNNKGSTLRKCFIKTSRGKIRICKE